MNPPIYAQREAASSFLTELQRTRDDVSLAHLLGALDGGSATARHVAARLAAFFEQDGFSRTVTSADVNRALLSGVQPREGWSTIGMQTDAKYAPYLLGDRPVDAEAYQRIIGVGVTESESAALDAQVRDVAHSIGLDHEVAFVSEIKMQGVGSGFAILGAFEAWKQPAQPLVVGIGLRAETVEHLELLYKASGGGPPGLRPMLEDFLKLDERQRIAAILVHERCELAAVHDGSKNPHRTAVDRAPHTTLDIDDRTRQHLELYRDIDQRLHGAHS